MNITSEKKGIINFTIHHFWAGQGGGGGVGGVIYH